MRALGRNIMTTSNSAASIGNNNFNDRTKLENSERNEKELLLILFSLSIALSADQSIASELKISRDCVRQSKVATLPAAAVDGSIVSRLIMVRISFLLLSHSLSDFQ